MAKIDALFKIMFDHGASDLHLPSGQKPTLRLRGEMERIEAEPVLENESLRLMLYEIAPEAKIKQFERLATWTSGTRLRAWPGSGAISLIRNTAARRCSG